MDRASPPGATRRMPMAPRARIPRQLHSSAGFSLPELLIVAALLGSLVLLSVPWASQDARAVVGELAARQLATVFRSARIEAGRRAATVAVEFVDWHGCTAWRIVADGDGDGVQADDRLDGIDSEIRAPVCLTWDFPGARIGIARPLPGIDGDGALAPGDDPLRLGAGDLARFTPSGTSSGGTVYLQGPDGNAFAVRVLASTGRVRVLAFDPARGSWVER